MKRQDEQTYIYEFNPDLSLFLLVQSPEPQYKNVLHEV